MSDPGGIPELQYNHPDGRQRTRLEMDQWLRQEIPKVHWLRIIASRIFSLPKQISWDMREIVLKHWLLDEMVRRQFITGDQLGVNVQNSNDEGELRQFTQRLAYLIQAGHAVSPQHAEGVDMSQFQPPPSPIMGAPVPPNGHGQQQVAYPPGPPQPPGPPGPPGGYAQPPMPPGPPGPPQGYAQPPMPPGPPPGPPQMGAPQGYAPPPPGGPGGPPMGPPPGVPQAGPPAAAPTGGRGGRRKADAAAPPPAPPGPPQPPGPPAGFAPAPAFPGGPQAPVAAPPQVGQPQGFAPLPPQGSPQQQFTLPLPQAAAPQQQQTAAVDPALGQKLDQVLTLLGQQAQRIAALEKQVVILSTLNTVLGRAMYQKPGSGDPNGFLTELGIPLPQ